jgi:hypothetical protein
MVLLLRFRFVFGMILSDPGFTLVPQKGISVLLVGNLMVVLSG